MPVRVIEPPEPIVTVADITSTNGQTTAQIEAMIAAATGEIDGPEGWLGRALGPQTLEYSTGWHCYFHEIRLPCPPLIDIETVTYLDGNQQEQELEDSAWQKTNRGLRWTGSLPAIYGWRDDAIRVRYRAGYDGDPVTEGGTGPVPDRIKQAIILLTQQMAAIGAENLFLSSEQVEGVGQTNYIVSPNAEALIQNTVENLLSGLRVY